MRAACAPAPAGVARCFTLYRPADTRAAANPVGWGATDIESAYRLPISQSSTALIGLSEAFDAPHLEQDLNKYRTQYGLGPCTTANGCFTKVNQDGAATPLPQPDPGWELETTLDVSMVSAACPHCRILVVEGNSPTFADLAATDDTAVKLGAQAVSNSYGSPEFGQNLRYAASYQHPGHVIVASTGDDGFAAASFPAVLSNVVAAGGTELTKALNPRGWNESAWQDGSSGCSAYVAKPAWQHDPHCSMRTAADVSAVADNIAIYNTDQGGWLTVGGTSASSPLIAGIYGLAGNASTVVPGSLYQHTDALFDITTGTNDVTGEQGGACGDDYLCMATTGYDAPTGLGTPNSLGAF